jgi:hypothetical protein
MTASTDFIVSRGDLRQAEIVRTPLPPLDAGQVLVRVDHFAFTANNVTYGAVGELIGYWNFFPARDGWGRIPVWGFGEVVASRHDALGVGERIYGYLPMSTHVVLAPDQVGAASFVDAAPHRAALPPIYNQYTRCAGDPTYSAAHEPQVALFRPLFTTAFLLDDFLAEHKGFGASQLLLSSASSKTALGLAFLHHARGRTVIGLTSAGNAAFVRGTGYYDRVATYDEIDGLPGDPTVFVDFAGSGALLERIHRHFGDRLRYSAQVGVTHWERMSAAADLPGPTPVFFFAPDQLLKRLGEWGPTEFQRRMGEATQRFLASTGWLRVVEGRGPAAVERVYRSMVDGRVDPAEGHMLSLV